MSEDPTQRQYQIGKVLENTQDRLNHTFELGIEIGSQLDKSFLTLSAGALVFSMTFVGTLAPERLLLQVLFAAWVAFGACLIFIILAMRFAQSMMTKRLREQDDAAEIMMAALKTDEPADDLFARLSRKGGTNFKVALCNWFALLSFLLGVVLLGIFVGYNLWHSVHPPVEVPWNFARR